MSLLPSRPDVSPDGELRVVDLDSETADELMAALSSETARQLLSELHEEPAPPSELADRVDTSLQNAQYHLEKLEEADAIEVVGTAYSEKGREMRVYGPADSPLVILAGETERVSGVRAALSRLFGGFLALAVGALAIQELFGESLLRAADSPPAEPAPTPTSTPPPEADGDGGISAAEATPTPTSTREAPDETEVLEGTPTPEATETPRPTETPVEATDTPAPTPEPTGTPVETPTEAPTPLPEEALEAAEGLFAAGLPPGLAFFLGGAIVLTVVVAMTYLQARL